MIEEEIEVAGGVGLDGVELALVGDGAQAGEDELLAAGGSVLGVAGLGEEWRKKEEYRSSGIEDETVRCASDETQGFFAPLRRTTSFFYLGEEWRFGRDAAETGVEESERERRLHGL